MAEALRSRNASRSSDAATPFDPEAMSIFIPHEHFTPSLAHSQAERLREAARVFTELGVKFGRHSAIVEAAQLLDEIAAQNTFVPPGRTARQVERALLLAKELPVIAEMLPPEAVPRMRDVVREATREGLASESSAAGRARAELYAGALFLGGGASVALVPTKQGARTPDYMVTVRGFECAVEVKRPGSPTAVVEKFEEAVGQSATFGRQAILPFIDVTDVVSSARADHQVDETAYTNATTVFADKCIAAVHRRTRSPDEKDRERFRHVIGVIVVAHTVAWRGPGFTHPVAVLPVAYEHLRTAFAGLVQDDSARVFGVVTDGIRALGGREGSAGN